MLYKLLPPQMQVAEKEVVCMQEGTVDQTMQTYLNKNQQEEGWVLTCFAYATSDCTIKTEQELSLIHI